MPIFIGVILLLSLFQAIIPNSFYKKIFTGNVLQDSFMGALIGSVASGSPINSYVIGGELLNEGISIIAIAAFIISWVTVGVIQFPAEAIMFDKKFALVRNILAFISAILIAILIYLSFSIYNA